MKTLSRRSFDQNAAAAAAGTAMLPVLAKGWFELAGAEAPGYFETRVRDHRRAVPQGARARRSPRAATSPSSTSSTRSATA